jgi:hypothetical protein
VAYLVGQGRRGIPVREGDVRLHEAGEVAVEAAGAPELVVGDGPLPGQLQAGEVPVTGVDARVDDRPNDARPVGVEGASRRVDLHGRCRPVHLGEEHVVRPRMANDRWAGGAVLVHRDEPLETGAGEDALVERSGDRLLGGRKVIG